jgi:hypothetical protein
LTGLSISVRADDGQNSAICMVERAVASPSIEQDEFLMREKIDNLAKTD